MDSHQTYDSWVLPLTKVQRRPQPLGSLLRDSLVSVSITRCREQSRLLIACAPPGSGKSTLLSQVGECLEDSGSAVAWLRVDTFDSPASIGSYLRSIPGESFLLIDDAHLFNALTLQECILPFLECENRPTIMLTCQQGCSLMQGLGNASFPTLTDEDLFFSRRDICALLESSPVHSDELPTLADILFDMFLGWPAPTCLIISAISRARSPVQLRDSLANALGMLEANIKIEDLTDCANLAPRTSSAVQSITSIAHELQLPARKARAIDTISELIFPPPPPLGRETISEGETQKEPALCPLGPKELLVLRHLAAGMKPKGIAEKLVISEQTVRTHLRNIYRKLDAHGRNDAIEKAILAGLL